MTSMYFDYCIHNFCFDVQLSLFLGIKYIYKILDLKTLDKRVQNLKNYIS